MSATMAKMMSSTPSVASPSTPPPSQPAKTSLPIRQIPGSYGWPLLGPISDRLNYFWFQGPATFFRQRIDKYKSTVFRTNVPPTFPLFLGVNPNVIAVLDVKSFSHLFEMDLVEKKDILVGEFMPSLQYTGGHRACAYQDTSEPSHSRIKNFAMDILKRSSTVWVPSVVSKLDTMWDSIESDLAKSGSVNAFAPLQQFIFGFLSRCLIGADPSVSPEIAKSGYIMLDKWLFLQLLPTVPVGILQPLEEIFLHSFSYPFFLVGGAYKRLVKFVEEHGKEAVERGQTEFKLGREEAVQNLLFFLGFNAFGGFTIFFPTLLNSLSDPALQANLRKEVREKLGKDSPMSIDSVKSLELVQSVVYETLRLNPPVPSQFGRARKDFVLSSHDSAFEIKKGELLCGYQPQVMRDPKIFEDPEKFVADRFTAEKGRELLSYLYWSNGPQTGTPSESNKQCAAKDYVTLTASMFVAYVFQRYDSIAIANGSITAVKKAK